jgi:hypothetical protein
MKKVLALQEQIKTLLAPVTFTGKALAQTQPPWETNLTANI